MSPEVEQYFHQFDGIALERLQTIRNLVLELKPGLNETIKYGIPTFLYHGNLLHYAAFKSHIGLYPLPATLEAFKSRIRHYKTGKGSIQFKYTEDFPVDLIRDIIIHRIKEIENLS